MRKIWRTIHFLVTLFLLLFFMLDLHFSLLCRKTDNWEDGKGRLPLLFTKRSQRKRNPSILVMQKVINIATGVIVCSRLLNSTSFQLIGLIFFFSKPNHYYVAKSVSKP